MKKVNRDASRDTVLLPTPFGAALRVTAYGDVLVAAEFVRSRARPGIPRAGVLREAAEQARAYFGRKLRRFDVPMDLEGTALAVDVWRTVAGLAFGDVVSYADIARAIGRPLAHRGVAMAMRKTPIDLFIPAHRVVGSDRRPRGCSPRSLRARLLRFEQV